MNKKLLVTSLGIGTVLLTPSLVKAQSEQKNETRPNVIILLSDDVGYGDLSCNGETTVHTPNVDKLAAEGVRFTDAHAVASTSTPSRYSILTGSYAWRRNDTGIAPGDAGMIIHPNQSTLGDLFQRHGYATAAIGKWHLGLGDKRGTQDWNGFITPGPKDIGFDYSYLMAATADRVPCVYVENQHVVNTDPSDPIAVSYKGPLPGETVAKEHPELLKMKSSPHQGHDQALINGIGRIGYMTGGKKALWKDELISDSITTHAIHFIEANKERPFFLYLGTNDVHVPRVPNPQFVGKSGMGPRGDAILELDWTVGQIVKTLKENNLYNNTLIVLTSDNGPVVDDGYCDQAVQLLGKHRPWGPFRGGKYSNFEAGTRIPMVVNWPGKTKHSVSNALVSQIDLFTSFAKILGDTPKAGEAPDSQNYLNAFLGKDKKGRPYVVEQAGALSIYDGKWKYIEPNNKKAYDPWTNIELGNSKTPQLYKIIIDKGEKKNKASENPAEIKRLKVILNKEKAKGMNGHFTL